MVSLSLNMSSCGREEVTLYLELEPQQKVKRTGMVTDPTYINYAHLRG